MKHSREWYLERLFLGMIWASEFAGVQIAIWTPDLYIPVYLLFLWMLVQVVISFFLCIQVWHAMRRKDKEKGRLVNISLICIALQCLGVFRSLQLFAGSVAITDSFFLYLLYHWD